MSNQGNAKEYPLRRAESQSALYKRIQRLEEDRAELETEITSIAKIAQNGHHRSAASAAIVLAGIIEDRKRARK